MVRELIVNCCGCRSSRSGGEEPTTEVENEVSRLSVFLAHVPVVFWSFADIAAANVGDQGLTCRVRELQEVGSGYSNCDK
jgi:hypothetical protein